MINNFKDFPSLQKEGVSSKLSDRVSLSDWWRYSPSGDFYIASMHSFKDFIVGMLYLKISCPLLPVHLIKKKKKTTQENHIIGISFKAISCHTPEPWRRIPYTKFGGCCSVISISEEKSWPCLEDLFFLLGSVFNVLWFNCQIISQIKWWTICDSSASSSFNWKVFGSRTHPLMSLERFKGASKIFRSRGKRLSQDVARTVGTVTNLLFPYCLWKGMCNSTLTPGMHILKVCKDCKNL